MNSISEMVEILRKNPVVAGLAEYGVASHLDDQIEGDYDLIVILEHGVPEIESLHFYAGGTPVDLNLRTLEQIGNMSRAERFECILLDARVIHDPSGRVGEALRSLRERHSSAPKPAIEPARIGHMRHGARHTFDKLRGSRDLPLTLKRYLFHQLVYWALRQYFEVRGLEYRGENRSLTFLRENEPDLYRSFEEFYATTDPAEQSRLSRYISEGALAPVGGLWKDHEVLTFGDPKRGREVFQFLFGSSADPEGTNV